MNLNKMKTVFDVYLNLRNDNEREVTNINTLDSFGKENFSWDLHIGKTDAGVEFALTLCHPVELVVPFATFSVESTDYVSSERINFTLSSPNYRHSVYYGSASNLLTNVATFEKRQKFCGTAANIKAGDVLRTTLPMCAAGNGKCVRCTIEFEESVKAESNEPQPSISQRLLKDAVSSEEPVKFADVILTTADDRKFHVHSCFLAKQSSVFNVMLQDENFVEGKERQIKTPDINSATMEEILRYVYTECVNLDALKVMAPEILYATEKYQFPEPLKLKCCQAMIDSLDVSNALSFLITADTYSLIDLKCCAVKVVVDNLNEIRKQDEWKEFLKKHPDLIDEIIAFTATCLNLKQ